MNSSPDSASDNIPFPRWSSVAVAAAIIGVSSLLAYSNSLSGPFVFDDIPTIVDSQSIQKLWPIGPVLLQGDTSALGRPLVNLSFALNYAYGGLDVTSYHVVNIMLHVFAGLILAGVVRRTLEQYPSSAHLSKHAGQISLFCSLIWVLHPLQTESVTYITQRAESLVGLFYLLTLYCAIRADSARRSYFWPTAAFLACLCGVGTKEVIVSAPVAVIMYDCTFSRHRMRSLLLRRRWLYGSLFSTWIPLLFLVSQGRQNSAGFGYGLSPWEYLLHQFGAITRYLRLSIWPDSLVLDYGVAATRNVFEIVPAAILVGLLVCGSVAAMKYRPWIGFLGFVFFATLSPSSSIIPVVTQTAAEHRMYLPLASIVIIAVVMIWHTCLSISSIRYGAGTSSGRGSTIAAFLLSMIAICFGSLTFARNFEYADAIRLWTTNIQRWPESLRPYMLIGSEYVEKKHDSATAILSYNRAILSYDKVKQQNRLTKHVDLQMAGVYFGRGTAHSHLRNFENALADFDRTLVFNPEIVDAHFYRGMVLGQMGREDEAIASITKALNLEISPERLFIRGELLGRKERYTDAISDLNLAIRMDETNPYFYQSRGDCLMKLGHYQDALADFSKALRMLPDFVRALQSRGETYALGNRHAQAVEDFSKVITLSPKFADAYRGRAKSQLSLGEIESARRDIEALETEFKRSEPELHRLLDELSTGSSSRTFPSDSEIGE